MSDELFIRYCAPTLAGMKTGSMFPCSYNSSEELTNDIRRANLIFVPKGLRVLPLHQKNGRALIYVFRPKSLAEALSDDTAISVLEKRGYKNIGVTPCICQLLDHFNKKDEFPHEVGIFLGYPPEDVSGFIENHAHHEKCTGCWKVYGDEDQAKRTFAKYKKCTDVYCNQYKKGKSIDHLTLAG